MNFDFPDFQYYYAQTPALKGYPKSQRFWVYRRAHKELMSQDLEYRRHWQVYLGAICAAVLVIGDAFGEWLPGYSKVFDSLSLVSSIGLVLWQQNYMNHQIDLYLREKNSPEGRQVDKE